LSALLLAGGIAAIVITLSGNTTKPKSSTNSNAPPQTVANPKSVPLSVEAQRVAARFILTAVQRKHLDEAWKISGPGVRAGLTHKQFLTGNIAVVPVPETIVQVKYKRAYSYSDNALLQVNLAVKHGASKTFYLGLKRYGKGAAAHWLVDSWEPYVPIPVRARP